MSEKQRLAPYPKLTGIDWSILSVVETNEQTDFEEPLAEISLEALSLNGIERLKVFCNKNQLQDFHWKVKEAYGFLQKMANKTEK